MNRDRYDLPLTTGSDRAAAFYRDGVDRILSAWYGADDAFDKAIAEDPSFALATIARARVHQLNMETAEARAKAAQARELATTNPPRTPACRNLAAAVEGQPKLALAGAEQHLDEFPRDALVFGLPARRVRPVRIFRARRPRRGEARDLRASRPALWRGLVVPDLSRLVAYRSRKRRHRPDDDRTGNWLRPKTQMPRMRFPTRCSSKAIWQPAAHFFPPAARA